MAELRREERFSGHESFVCRYGWLPKVYAAISDDPLALKDEARATLTLGIGRNMVKSVQFWSEAFGVLEARAGGGLQSGPLGRLLLSNEGWDPYLENSESLWLLHWWITTQAELAVWNLVFGGKSHSRFDRITLVKALDKRAQYKGKKLAGSTLEQHVGLFLQSYRREASASDDTSWCPLQDLDLFEQALADDGSTVYLVGRNAPLGLSSRVFMLALNEFSNRTQARSISLETLLYSPFSPGVVFRLDEFQLRQLLVGLEAEYTSAVRFVDTADTQHVIFDPTQMPTWAQHLRTEREGFDV